MGSNIYNDTPKSNNGGGKNIEKRVFEIICESLAVKPESFNIDSKLVEDLGMDSLDTVEIIMKFENEFGASIPDEEAQKIVTVRDIVNFLEKSVN